MFGPASFQAFCGLVGLVAVSSVAIKLLLWVKLNFLATCDVKRRYAKAGSWAIVTGAGDGIGRAFSIELAKAGLNVAVISRTKSKLDDVAAECAKYGVETRVVPFDFSAATTVQYKKLFTELGGITPAVLVNNVGINYDYPRYIETVADSLDQDLLKVNCEPTIMLTKFVLPHMKAKRCGAIINLASVSAVVAAPMLSTYSATKAFNLRFSLSLETEVSRHGIDVLAVTPGFVISNMSKINRESFSVVAARPMARQTLNKLGSTGVTAGHWHHQLIEDGLKVLPTQFRNGKSLDIMIKTSKRAERKAAETAAKAPAK